MFLLLRLVIDQFGFFLQICQVCYLFALSYIWQFIGVFLGLFMGVLLKIFYVIFSYFTGINLLVKGVAPSSFCFNFKVISDSYHVIKFSNFWWEVSCMPPWRLFEIGVELFYGIWRYYRLSAPDMALEFSIVCLACLK